MAKLHKPLYHHKLVPPWPLILQVSIWSSAMRKSFEMATTICHVMSCYVMLCYVSHFSHLNVPQTVWTRRTHWGFSIWGPSPLPDICKALKARTKWPPKSDLPEIRFQKHNRKKHPKYMDLNDLICRFYDCFMPEFSKRLRPAQVGTFKVRTYSTSMSLRSCRSLESYWNQPAK